jgi:hypothetical protein
MGNWRELWSDGRLAAALDFVTLVCIAIKGAGARRSGDVRDHRSPSPLYPPRGVPTLLVRSQ